MFEVEIWFDIPTFLVRLRLSMGHPVRSVEIKPVVLLHRDLLAEIINNSSFSRHR